MTDKKLDHFKEWLTDYTNATDDGKVSYKNKRERIQLSLIHI